MISLAGGKEQNVQSNMYQRRPLCLSQQTLPIALLKNFISRHLQPAVAGLGLQQLQLLPECPYLADQIAPVLRQQIGTVHQALRQIGNVVGHMVGGGGAAAGCRYCTASSRSVQHVLREETGFAINIRNVHSLYTTGEYGELARC